MPTVTPTLQPTLAQQNVAWRALVQPAEDFFPVGHSCLLLSSLDTAEESETSYLADSEDDPDSVANPGWHLGSILP